MSKTVLVTGLSGFIGYHVVEPLINTNFNIINTNRSHPIKEHRLDLLNPENVKYVLEYHKPEYLLHLAWDVSPGYRDNPNNIDWMNASLNLIHQFSVNGGRRAVIAGTCYDYNPHTLYGTCKRSLWNILNYANYATTLELAYGRIYYLYGTQEPKQRLVPTVINGLLTNKTVELNGTCSQVMNLSYVQDVADGLVIALDSAIVGEFDIYGDTISLGVLGDAVTELMDLELGSIKYGSNFEAPRDYYDTYIRDKLLISKNWQPSTSLLRGLTKTINWWKEQRKE